MERINGILFKQMLESGMNNLSNHSAEIDALNVFPVPDGDTGTNMHLTVSNGVKEALKTNSDSVKDIAKTLSRGLLMGARGNSGVITSQIFRGIYQAVEDLDDMDASQLAHALVNGSRVAYRAVMRPVEGTILTVVREAADYTYAYTTTEDVTDCMDVMKKMVEEANASLQRTPELLPVLAEVGVVDSGGKGLCVILEGFLAAMEGHPVQLEGAKAAGESAQAKVEGGEEEYGFCTEFILKLSENGVRHFSETSFKDELATIGNSIVCVQDEDLVKVHVHTLEPFTAIKMGRRQGRFIKLKVENMQEQHDNIIEKEEEEKMAEHKKYAIITVAPGDGIKKMFTELRADIVVGGGQTMNPSTEDMVQAVRDVNAKNVIILPNNSNIVMTAQQTATILEDEINVIVIPTKTIPQGLSACIMFNPDASLDDNIEEMNEAVSNVKTGQVTFAIKDTNIDGVEIKANDYMALVEKNIVACLGDKLSALKVVLEKLVDEDAELITLIYGEDVNDDDIEEIESFVEDNFEAELEVINGKQPVYSFIVGVE